LTTPDVTFFGAKEIKLPYLTLAGYRDHGRDGGFNRSDITANSITKTLGHDRDVEFFIDSMDVDETNQALAASNLTNVFEREHAIPETDAYRVSKIYSDFVALGGTVDSSSLNVATVLTLYDKYMEAMDEAETPSEGRVLYVSSKVNTLLKENSDSMRMFNAQATGEGKLNRIIRSLDDVKVVQMPSSRMRSAYDFTDGFVPASNAKIINMILIHPKSVIACNKHSYIKLWPPGSHTQGDGYLYQNRQYGDLFLISTRIKGVAIHATNPPA
jgi:hypothetical protein